MDFGNIVGGLLQQGMGGATRGRLEHSLGNQGLGGLAGGGLDDLLGNIMGGGQQQRGAGGGGGLLGNLMGGGQQRGGGGGLLGNLASMMGGKSGVGGMSNAQVGGIGAIAGALLGGGGGAMSGAVKGGAMALLGTLAVSALKNWQANSAGAQQQAPGSSSPMGQLQVSEDEVRQMVSPQTAELCLKSMIAAAKSDGQIQDDEMQRIVGKLEEGGISQEERQFVVEEMGKPLDICGITSAVPNQQVGAQVYAAALMAIEIDTPAEQQFMQQLAQGLGLDHGTVGRLHQMVGAPA